jgi:hypothetical protein
MNSVSPFSNPLAGKLAKVSETAPSPAKAEKAGKPGKAKKGRRKNAEGVASQG